MTESQTNLTVKVKLEHAAAEAPGRAPGGKYRWDRIFTVAALLLLVVAATSWLLRPPSSAPPVGPEAALDPTLQPAAESGDGSSTTVGEIDTANDTGSGLSAGGPGGADNQVARTDVPGVVAGKQGPGQADAEAQAIESEGTSVASTIPLGDAPVTVGTGTGSEQAASGPTEDAPTEIAGTDSGSVQRDSPVTAIDTRIISAQVRRFVITDAVKGREPVGGIDDIRPDGKVRDLVKVIAFSEVSGFGGKTLRYRWVRGDKVSATVPVRVGSDSWRSYTSKYLNREMRGRWRVELVTDRGEVLAITEFEF